MKEKLSTSLGATIRGSFWEVFMFNHSSHQVRKMSILRSFLLILVFLPTLSHALNGFDLSRHSIPLDEIRLGGPPRDGIPAILAPRFISASEASYLQDDHRVLGIVGSREAKAYPIHILNWHEIVNDTLEGKPIVITYCPLCGTGIGFERVVKGKPVTFGVSGLLYQSDLLMYDHQTETLWSQIGMEAVAGPQTGQRLTHLFLEHMSWKEWREAHPHTRVLSRDTGFKRDYDRDPYLGYGQRADLLFPTTTQSKKFHSKAWILGVEVQGLFKAYPFSELEKSPQIVRDKVGDQTLFIHFRAAGMHASVKNERGEPVPSIMAYWFAWYAFHPETQVFRVVAEEADQP